MKTNVCLKHGLFVNIILDENESLFISWFVSKSQNSLFGAVPQTLKYHLGIKFSVIFPTAYLFSGLC